MPLLEHLRELRSRLLKAAVGLTLGALVGFWFFDPIWQFLQSPYCDLDVSKVNKGADGKTCGLVTNGLTQGFFLYLKISLIVGAVLSSPLWLYQLWAFVAPGLHQREKRWTYTFLVCAVPLFLLGATLSYVTLDKGLQILLGFTPDGVQPLVTIDSYLGYMIAMLLVFGITFELPLFVVILNLAGVVKHEKIAKHRRSIIFGLFVFAAVATPSADPFTMLALALPTVVLFEFAELIAFFHDRRHRDDEELYEGLDDDEISVIDERQTPVDGPSSVDVP
ncbi:MAG: twin-arginine translocase subunit TatC [Streptosporangiaceae bacterium]